MPTLEAEIRRIVAEQAEELFRSVATRSEALSAGQERINQELACLQVELETKISSLLNYQNQTRRTLETKLQALAETLQKAIADADPDGITDRLEHTTHSVRSDIQQRLAAERDLVVTQLKALTLEFKEQIGAVKSEAHLLRNEVVSLRARLGGIQERLDWVAEEWERYARQISNGGS